MVRTKSGTTGRWFEYEQWRLKIALLSSIVNLREMAAPFLGFSAVPVLLHVQLNWYPA